MAVRQEKYTFELDHMILGKSPVVSITISKMGGA